MRAVIQRCHAASVEVEGEIVGQIERGLAVFLGVAEGDNGDSAAKLVQKIVNLRIFDNEEGKFDRSLVDVRGAALVISNFTLYGDVRKGNRPNFSGAARPENAQEIYECFVTLLKCQGIAVHAGQFGAHMNVRVENDGPVTLILDF